MAPEDQIREQTRLEAQISQAILSCLEASGKPPKQALTADTVPLEDLEDFDSLCVVEVVVELEEKLQRELEEEVFVTGTGKKAKPRSIREVAAAILSAQKVNKPKASKKESANG